MAKMKMIVFNVEQGLCVYIRTPNDYGILIDCGRSDSGAMTSPVDWLTANELPSLKQYRGSSLAAIVLTHSHDSHASDMDTVNQQLKPAVTCNADNCDLDDVPDLGATVRTFAISRQEAQDLGGDPWQIANNQSIITVVAYTSEEGYSWKVVVSGDNETQSLEALLEKPEFRDEIADTDFFVTPYHGQESGLCARMFEAMGKPIANISSARAQDKRADSRYGKLAQGVKFPDGTRKDFFTRDDGNITVEMHDDGRYDVWLFTPSA